MRSGGHPYVPEISDTWFWKPAGHTYLPRGDKVQTRANPTLAARCHEIADDVGLPILVRRLLNTILGGIGLPESEPAGMASCQTYLACVPSFCYSHPLVSVNGGSRRENRRICGLWTVLLTTYAPNDLLI